MFESGVWILLSIIAPCLLASACAYAFISQRRLTMAQRRDLEDALEGDYVDNEDSDDCPVRIDMTRRKAGPSRHATPARPGIGAQRSVSG
jgi:hypothetical protein